MQVIEQLIKSIRGAAVYNPDVQVAPTCILWPDKDRQWGPIIPRLQAEMPELLILGNYITSQKTGPAIWLRCAIAGKIEDLSIPKNKIPILYLPGVGRQDLRAVENCPDHLKPLAELQYRGTTWSQINAKDWTILAFLKSDQGGLGLDVSQDNPTLNAMKKALYRFVDKKITEVKDRHLDKDYFNTLLTGGDPVKEFLRWLDNNETFRAERDENQWQGFVEISKSRWNFDPENDGIIAGAENLARHEGPWQSIWERYCDSPSLFPNIPAHIRKTPLPPDPSADKTGWPQWNENEEQNLRAELLKTSQMPVHEAREFLITLSEQHKKRCTLVWTKLGESPLALALRKLAIVAQTKTTSLAAGTIDDVTKTYILEGWVADDALLEALSYIQKKEDLEAVQTALHAVYLPWADEAARHLQQLVESSGYPGDTVETRQTPEYSDGECLLFIDGLRLDLGKRLSALLGGICLKVTEKPTWTPLPSVTATGKPAVTPAANHIRGEQANSDFEPSTIDGKSLKGGYRLPKLIKNEGWEILKPSETGKGTGYAWTEIGDIDHDAHNRGWKIARSIDGLLFEIRDRIKQLLDAGWKKVRVVTDHGWLLLPGGLPKIDLPAPLAENKWGRCAAIKPGAKSHERLFPWYWNHAQHFALADGVNCYRAGLEYAHGGLSVQECLTLELIVTASQKDRPISELEISEVAWRGLRCKVDAENVYPGLSLDIRLNAGNPSSSVVKKIKPLNEDGFASVVVENEDYEGVRATVVLIDGDGQLAAQAITTIGGGKNERT